VRLSSIRVTVVLTCVRTNIEGVHSSGFCLHKRHGKSVVIIVYIKVANQDIRYFSREELSALGGGSMEAGVWW